MKTYITILFMLLAFAATAQIEPHWISSSWRQSQYPGNTFLTGFSQDMKAKDETVAEATERVKNLAVGDLSENLVTNVESVSENYAQSVEYGGNEKIKKVFASYTTTQTDAKINGINVDSYHNPKTNQVYAFAYANKYEVMGYYKANINMHLQQIEGYVANAKQFAETAEKAKAEGEYKKTIPLFSKVEYAQGLLSAVDKNADESGLQMQKSIQLRNNVVQALSELKQGIYVFLNCSAIYSDSTKSTLLESKLKAELARQGCSFVYDKAEADWLITIDANAREYNLSYGSYFSYVDANLNIVKAYNKQHVYQDQLTKKGGSTRSYKAAAETAYNEIINPILTELLQYLKQ